MIKYDPRNMKTDSRTESTFTVRPYNTDRQSGAGLWSAIGAEKPNVPLIKRVTDNFTPLYL